jgi:Flp pilus assembly protein TadG
MLSPLIRRAGRGSGDARLQERGVTLALVAAAMVAMIAMAALSIDVGTLYQAKAEAQRAADAAALAAARVISISGVTGDPNTVSSWEAVCGTSGTATLAANSVAQAQWNFVNGIPAPTVTVTYGTGAGSTDCSTLAGSTSNFTVNPTVTVYVQQPNVSTFFGRIFALIPGGTSKNSGVSGTATAEVFNPSGSGTLSSGMVPVQPRCVKPWIVPDADPIHTTCSANGCKFVDPTGAIVSPGVTLAGTPGGVIGETFNLVADCAATGNCNSQKQPPAPYFVDPPQPNGSNAAATTPKPNLQYLPALVQNPSPAASSCVASGSDQREEYQQAIAGCDNTTPYQCGLAFGGPSSTQVNLNENPYGANGDTSLGAQCLIHASSTGQANSGQDTLVNTSFPFVIQAGSANPLNVGTANVSSSTSVVSLPIYDSTTVLNSQTQEVTVIGFLQVFINYVNTDGSLNVTVLNVAGCSDQATATSPFVTGSSPVPVRLITPPVPAQ